MFSFDSIVYQKNGKYSLEYIDEYDKIYQNIKLLISNEMDDEIKKVLVFMFKKIRDKIGNIDMTSVVTVPNNMNAQNESVIFILAN